MSFSVVFSGIACGGDETDASAPPLGPPNLRIEALSPAGKASWTPSSGFDCVEHGGDENGTVAVVVGERVGEGRLRNWTLRPFQGCGTTLQCGVVLLTIERDGTTVFTAAAAATSIPVPAGRLGLAEGRYSFRVELRDDRGALFVHDAGAMTADSIEVDVRPSCSGFIGDSGAEEAGGADADVKPPPDASPDAEGDAMSTPDASGGLSDTGVGDSSIEDAGGTGDASSDATGE